MAGPLQLSRHVYLARSSGGGRGIVARNALQGTSMPLSLDEWQALGDRFARPAEAAGPRRALVDRAVRARILVGGPETPPHRERLHAFLARVEGAVAKAAGAGAEGIDRGTLRERLERARLWFEAWLVRTVATRVRWKGVAIADLDFAVSVLRAFPDLAWSVVEQANRAPARHYVIDPDLCADALLRPRADRALEQAPCMPACATWRAGRIARAFPRGARVLALGDDDLVSVALAPLGDFEIHVLDTDARLLEGLRRIFARRGRSEVRLHHADLRDGLPPALVARFDAVVTDPPYSARGMARFVTAAVAALRRDGAGPVPRLYLSTNPRFIEAPPALFRALFERGLIVVRHHECKNYYRVTGAGYRYASRALRSLEFPLAGAALEDLFAGVPYLYSDLLEAALVAPARRPVNARAGGGQRSP